LEEKLQIAVEEQKKLSEYRVKLDDDKLKIAQIENLGRIMEEEIKKISSERKNFLAKISKLDLELSNLKHILKLESPDEVKLKIAQFQMKNETLKKQYENVFLKRNVCKKKISELETELFDIKE